MQARSTLFCALALFAWAGPLQAQSAPLVGVRVASGTTVEGGGTIAALALPGGARVEFLALHEGRVGVAETAPAGAALQATPLIRMWHATPLELFMALAPGVRPPNALRVDHLASGRSAARVLTLPPLMGVPIDLFDCDPVENFEDDWHDTYTGVTTVVVSKSYVPFSASSYTWYPGAHAYHGTNINLTTHFGICAGDRDAVYTVKVERRVNGATWAHSVTAMIGYNARFTFHTNIPGIYRMSLSSSDEISQLAAGAAYTPAPPVAGEP